MATAKAANRRPSGFEEVFPQPFWRLYRREKGLIPAWMRDELVECIDLELMNIRLEPRS